MVRIGQQVDDAGRVDPEELFRRLGLVPADARPIRAAWAEANLGWKRERTDRLAQHARRVENHLRRFRRSPFSPPLRTGRKTQGQPHAIWCVELGRCFATLTAAGAFVGRSPSNIQQALHRGARCGSYHWEEYDERKHSPRAQSS